MSSAPLLLKMVDSIAHLILNNPPKNEMNTHFFNALTRMRKDQFPSIKGRGVILYGKGRHFSSGADLDELATLYHSAETEPPSSFLNENIHSFLAIESLPFPSVAVINGCCLGAGLELALSCRYRIASANAVFSLPESTFGLMPGCGGTIRLPQLIGTGNAIEMILSGKIVSSEEALAIGLIDKIVEKKKGVQSAIELIEDHNSKKKKIFSL